MTSKPSGVSLTKNQAEVLAYVLDRVETDEDVEVLEFALAQSDEPFRAAVLGIGVDEERRRLRVVMNLPTRSNGIFFGVTVDGAIEVARILANLEDCERDSGRNLHPLECVVTDGPGNLKAMFLLRTASHGGLSDIPDDATIKERKLRFSLVIGLNESEYGTKLRSGADALLDLLQDSGKSLIFFEPG